MNTNIKSILSNDIKSNIKSILSSDIKSVHTLLEQSTCIFWIVFQASPAVNVQFDLLMFPGQGFRPAAD